MSTGYDKRRSKRIGSLWANISGKGQEYFTGIIEIDGKKHKVIVFQNTYCKDTQPDFAIFEREGHFSKLQAVIANKHGSLMYPEGQVDLTKPPFI